MKPVLLIFTLFIISSVAQGQMISGSAEIFTVYSQNERFYLKSIPYDDESPSLRGTTSVYERGKSTPLYTLDRGFDPEVGDLSNTLILSNDGEVIFYVVSWDADEEKDGLRSINIYKNGKLIRSFTESQITGCDKKKERCSLLYSNYDVVVDPQKSNFGTENYKKVLKEGVDEKEAFLSDFAIFSFEDLVYLTDSKKRIHTFDLRDGRQIESDAFENVFDRIKTKGRLTKTEEMSYEAPSFQNFPKLKDGRDAHVSLANYIGMKAGYSMRASERYKWYIFELIGTISRDGTVEIESTDVDSALPKDKILQFFTTRKFDTSSIPKVFPKWHLGSQYFYVRNPNNRIAQQEKRQERIKQRQDFQKRLTLESIDGVYIPANLGECFVELDKRLSEIDKKEMTAKPHRDDMIIYHHGLGTWIRNNWGLWGGSRLQKYFTDRAITHPDDMSGVILDYYHDWLTGKKETWKEWEKNPTQR
ncbi:MAG TPA: DUF6794 domain-containing protein [Pyrinomonadaceae bacterium]|nr:DUF6794 domain-containing protein [Pyrinomonadaceae bacterium]